MFVGQIVEMPHLKERFSLQSYSASCNYYYVCLNSAYPKGAFNQTITGQMKHSALLQRSIFLVIYLILKNMTLICKEKWKDKIISERLLHACFIRSSLKKKIIKPSKQFYFQYTENTGRVTRLWYMYSSKTKT